MFMDEWCAALCKSFPGRKVRLNGSAVCMLQSINQSINHCNQGNEVALHGHVKGPERERIKSHWESP